MTSDFYEIVRTINFVILFVAFLVMVYKGVFNLALGGKLEWDRLLNLSWVILAVYSVGEVLYMSTTGGPRILLQTVVAVMQLYVVLFHFHAKKEAK